MLTTETKCLMAALLAVLLGMALSMDVGDTVPTGAPLYHHSGLNVTVWATSRDELTAQWTDSQNSATTMSSVESGIETGLGGFFPTNTNQPMPARPESHMLPEPPGGMEQGRFSPDRGFDSRVSWD
ncbi:MAG: hypothetical protein J5861_02865 [Desulfovibrio sp.]|nr:hypothetical protein [Desulfovibrio sp.]